MDAAERRKLYRQESDQRHQERYADREDTGRFRDIFEPEKKEGVIFWRDSQADHDFYIVPYITGKKHPRLSEGKMAIACDVFIHRGIGVNEDSYICLNKTYGRKCPVCEYQAELREDDSATDAEVKALNASRRSIYNIVCLDSTEERNKGVQVWPVSHFKFTIPLEELAHKKKGGGNIPYGDVDKGKVISFRRKGKGLSTEYTAFEFKDREDIPDAILESAVCLDEMMHVPEYQEVYDAFYAALKEPETSEKEEERKPKGAPAPAPPAPPTPPPATPAPAPTPAAETAKASDVPTEIAECALGAVFGTDYMEYEECKKDCDPNLRGTCMAKSCEIKGTFGKEYNQHEKCKECPSRRPCRVKLDELEEAADKLKGAGSASPPIPEKKKLTRRAV
jgi:hypothetical protein